MTKIYWGWEGGMLYPGRAVTCRIYGRNIISVTGYRGGASEAPSIVDDSIFECIISHIYIYYSNDIILNFRTVAGTPFLSPLKCM